MKKLLTMLRKGVSILPKNHYKRKSRVEPFQNLISAAYKYDSTISVKRLRECLVCILSRNRVQNIEQVPLISPNELVEIFKERRALRQLQQQTNNDNAAWSPKIFFFYVQNLGKKMKKIFLCFSDIKNTYIKRTIRVT